MLDELAGLVTPDTILRWYRDLIAKKYDSSSRRGTGGPATARTVQNSGRHVRVGESRLGTYTRIRGALHNLGHAVGRATIKRILREQGLEPAPSRSKRMPWKTYLKAHLGAIAATDFFTVEVLALAGLQLIRAALVATGSFPLPVLLHEMGISHRMVHADALEQGALRFDRDLQEYWLPRFVSFKADYGVFVPSELEVHVGEFIR